jgi:hypothetical protein
MRRIAFLMLLFCHAAQADMYRWIDPETGSVKFSNLPPQQRPGVAVEVLRAQPPPPIAPAPAIAAPPASPERVPMTELEARWRSALRRVAEALEQPGVDRSDPHMQELVSNVEAANVELDRMDPNGAAARRRDMQATMQRIRRVVETPR